MKASIHYLILFLYALCLVPLHAQDISFEHLTNADGLSHYTVLSIYQDERGLMWFGTANGVSLYNGKSIKVYKQETGNPNSLPNNHVNQIIGNRKGTIFFRTQSGVSAFNIKEEKFTTLFSKQATSLFFNEHLYMAYKNQLFKFDEDKFSLFYELPDKEISITAIHIGNDSIVIGTSKHGTYVLHGEQLSHPIPQGQITNIFRDSIGDYWITDKTGENGLYRMNRTGLENYKYIESNANSLISNYTHCCCEDKQGNIWIGTLYGLTKYDKKEQKFTRYPKKEHDKSLSYPSIWNLYCDRQGTIWAGTYFGGVSYFNPDRQFYREYFPSLKEEEGLSSSIIGRMTEDNEHNLWICTDGGGLNKYNRKTHRYQWYRHHSKSNSISHNNVKTLYHDSIHHTLWLGTHLGGLNKLDLRTGRFTNYRHDKKDTSSIPSNIIEDIIPLGERLLLATSDGIGVFDTETEKCTPLLQDKNDRMTTQSTLGLLIDSKGILWITNNFDGACAYNFDTKNLTVYKKRQGVSHGISSNNIRFIFEDSRKRLWFCTNERGIDLYDRETGQFKNYNAQKNGLAGNQVFNICEIAPDQLLMTTDQGISVLDCETEKFTNYTNLPLASFKQNALYRTKDGEIFIGGVAGMVSLTQESIKAFDRTYTIFPSKLIVNEQEVSVSDNTGILSQSLSSVKQLTLHPDQNVLNIEYAITDYIPYNEDIISYRLEGFSDNWMPLNKQNTITYTNLSPGTYTLVVKAQNKRSELIAESSLRIKILPPFYRTTWAYLFYTLCIACIVYFLVRSYNHRIKLQESLKYEKKHAEDIEKMNQAKLRFFTNISHEFRTPLTLIIGQIEALLQIPSCTPGIYNKILGSYKNCLQLKELINELLDFRKQEQGYMTIKVKEGNIVGFLYEYYLLFQEYARQRKISFDFLKANENIPLWYDAKQMQKVVNNLLSNAFKHTPEGGRISLSVKKRNQEVLIEVTDNGTGIPPKDIEKIFDRFYQTEQPDASPVTPSVGIGLALTKGIIELHHGTIEVFSELGEGTTFCIHLKCGNEHLTAEQLSPKTDEEQPATNYMKQEFRQQLAQEKETQSDENEPATKKSKILIVEDNNSLREMLTGIFEPFYTISTASNGAEGLEKVQSEQPDIVLSDVLMPLMSGIELCQSIKKNMETCHIPVVLLTARTAIEHAIEGLKIGADDYITKPFNINILLTRCNNLVNSRIMLQEKFNKQPQITPYVLATNEIDKKFIDQVMNIIEKHIDDAEFRVDKLAEELCIARSKLFIKIKAITNQTPNDFIMTLRLKRAAIMLKNNMELNISEISDQLGFSSPRYFTKCFKGKYHIAPQEYRKKYE